MLAKRFIKSLMFCSSALALSACAGSGSAPIINSAAPATHTGGSAIPAASGPAVVVSAAASTQKMTYRVGPLRLNAAATADQVQENGTRYPFQVSEALWVTRITSRVEDAAGNELPAELLHAAWLENHNEANPFCTSGNAGNPFAAANATTKTIQFPEGYGYALLPTDRLEASVTLHNTAPEEYADVYFTFTIEGVAMNTGAPMRDVKAVLLEHDPCTHEPMAVEPGKYVTQNVKGILPQAGKVIGAYGLLQRNGVAVTLGKESDKEPFWKASAKLNANRDVSELPVFQDTAGVPVKSGESLVLTVAYQNDSPTWFNDATAAALVFVAPNADDLAVANKPYITKRAAYTATESQALLIK